MIPNGKELKSVEGKLIRGLGPLDVAQRAAGEKDRGHGADEREARMRQRIAAHEPREKRSDAGHGERDRDVRAKVQAAHASGLTAIVCVGETGGERDQRGYRKRLLAT